MKKLFLLFSVICTLASCRKENEIKVTADFLVYDTLLQVGEHVDLKNLSDSISTFYLWDFGDGFTSNSKCPFHSYEQPGNYTIKLIVNKNNSISETAFQKVRVGECLVYQIVMNSNYQYKWYPDDFIWDADSTGIAALPDVFIIIKDINKSPSYESETLYNLSPTYLPITFEIPDIPINKGSTGIYLNDRDSSDSETLASNFIGSGYTYPYDKSNHQGEFSFNSYGNSVTVRYKIR